MKQRRYRIGTPKFSIVDASQTFPVAFDYGTDVPNVLYKVEDISLNRADYTTRR